MKILLTGTGFPGTHSIISSLRESFDDVLIYGIDAQEHDLCKIFVNDFDVAPHGSDPSYPDFILNLCREKKIDVILPTTTAELPSLQKIYKKLKDNGTMIPMCWKTDYNDLNNKWLIMRVAESLGIPVPKNKLVRTFEDLHTSIYTTLGYPEKECCIKPVISNGGKGFYRIAALSLHSYYSNDSKRINYNELLNLLPHSGTFTPHLVAMEYLPGREYTVDMLADRGRMIYAVPRTRDWIRSGISFVSTTVRHDDIITWCETLASNLHIHGPCGFQFREDENGIPKLIECNPRLQGGSSLCVMSGADIFADAVHLAMGESIDEPAINWGIKMIRFYNEIYV